MMYHVIDETLAGWWRLQAQESCQPAVFLHNDSIHIQQTSDVGALRSDGDRQSGQEDSGGHPKIRSVINHLSSTRVNRAHICTGNE